MRPPEKWAGQTAAALRKEPAKRKRAPAKKKVAQLECKHQSTDGLYLDSKAGHNPGQSSVPNEAGQAQSRISGKQKRASSLGPQDITNADTQRLRHAAAAAALTRAIQSSPPRFPGSKSSPIELDADLSPQPTRRLLFPSPRKFGEIKSLEIPAPGCDDYKTVDAAKWNGIYTNPAFSSDKENLPPTEDDGDDNLSHLFNGEESNATPRTPSSGSLLMDTILHTPSVSSRRKALTPKGFLSSAAKRWRTGPETPSRALSHGHPDVTEMTPFTAQLAQLISEANQQSPYRGHNRDLSVFEDHGTEENSLAMLSEFKLEDFEPEMQMNSSAPAFFSLYEEPADSSGALWNDGNLLGSALHGTVGDASGHREKIDGATLSPSAGGLGK